MLIAASHDHRSEGPHLLVEQAHSIVVGVIRAKAVRADHFRQPVGLVRGRRAATTAHLAETDAQPAFRKLPGCFGAGEAAADDVDVEGHVRAVSCVAFGYPATMRIFTIGYEGATMDGFIAALKHAGVERVIDVRALPLSRRPGFSKTPLCGALDEAGIEYVHLKALGTPAEGRSAARAGRHADLQRIYAGQLELSEAMVQSAQMVELAKEKPSALLCFDASPPIATGHCC